jgi:drug/metabolite transporter (DMT)-like permease
VILLAALRPRPELAVLASTLLWGTVWVPIRQVNEGGVVLATVVATLVAVVALAPAWAASGRAGRRPRTIVVGLLFGIGAALYFEGLVRGQVARVVLLFYLLPIWGVLLGRLINGVPVTARRVLGVVLGLSGMLVVFSGGGGWPLPKDAADWMGVVSGMFWALAFAIAARPGWEESDTGQSFFTLVTLVPAFWLLAQWPGSRAIAAGAVFGGGLWPWAAALGLLWLLPGIFLTIHGASRLDPGKVAILLMMEVVFALVSAAVLAGEPFGLREVAGAVLIVGAGLSEMAGGRKSA